MSDFVKQSNRAKLRTEQPYNLAKLNAYISLWGLGYIVTALLMATEKDATPIWWLIAFVLILVTLAGNICIYLKSFPLRMIGYVINIGFHGIMALVTLLFILPWTLRGTAVIAILWWYNPFARVIKVDLDLQDLDVEKLPPADPEDDYDTPAGWDEQPAARRRR